jgi:hypothetical protein
MQYVHTCAICCAGFRRANTVSVYSPPLLPAAHNLAQEGNPCTLQSKTHQQHTQLLTGCRREGAVALLVGQLRRVGGCDHRRLRLHSSWQLVGLGRRYKGQGPCFIKVLAKYVGRIAHHGAVCRDGAMQGRCAVQQGGPLRDLDGHVPEPDSARVTSNDGVEDLGACMASMSMTQSSRHPCRQI